MTLTWTPLTRHGLRTGHTRGPVGRTAGPAAPGTPLAGSAAGADSGHTEALSAHCWLRNGNYSRPQGHQQPPGRGDFRDRPAPHPSRAEPPSRASPRRHGRRLPGAEEMGGAPSAERGVNGAEPRHPRAPHDPEPAGRTRPAPVSPARRCNKSASPRRPPSRNQSPQRGRKVRSVPTALRKRAGPQRLPPRPAPPPPAPRLLPLRPRDPGPRNGDPTPAIA